MKQKKMIFIIDGSAFLYRAYYGLPAMRTKNGRPISVVFGFCRILKKFIDDFDPHYLAIAWDTPSEVSAWRKQLYSLYKANRNIPPKELNEQRVLVKQFCSLIGLSHFEIQNEEADDIMYSLSRDLAHKKFCVTIVTQDKDLRQAINRLTITYDPFKKTCFDTQLVHNFYGFGPRKLAFYYALIGDRTDNIPGVTGIGPKKAKILVKQFSSLTSLYKNLERVSEKEIVHLLLAHKKEAFLSYKLFKLRYYNMQISTDCSFNKENWRKAYGFFKTLDFQSLINDHEETI